MYKVICLVGVIPGGRQTSLLGYSFSVFLLGVLLFVLKFLFHISVYGLQLCVLIFFPFYNTQLYLFS